MARPRGPERRARGGPGRQPQHIAAVEVEAIILDYVPGGIATDPHPEHRSRPVVQAVGLRRLHLVDGIPLTPVDMFEKVTLAREVVYKVPIYVKLPTGGVKKVRTVGVSLACIPGGEQGERVVYCYPVEPLEPSVEDSLKELLEKEPEGGKRSKHVLVSSPDELARVAEEQGKPGKIVCTPQDPINYHDLTDIAKDNLLEALRRLVREKEDLFVEFFNIAEPINIRMHAIETLRGVGKRTLRNLLWGREQKPFTSFDEIKKILKIDPAEALAERLLLEVECGYGCERGEFGAGRQPEEGRCAEVKYYLFIEPCDPSKPYFRYLERMWKAMALRSGRGGGAKGEGPQAS